MSYTLLLDRNVEIGFKAVLTISKYTRLMGGAEHQYISHINNNKDYLGE